MIQSLDEPLQRVGERRKTLEVYTESDGVVAELTNQFSTRNVQVTQYPFPAEADREFVIVRNDGGTFCGAIGLAQLDAILSPSIHPPPKLADTDVDLADLFDFLDRTVFTSFDRRQMLAVSREIEDRAWRVGNGDLYVGFQNAAAVRAQLSLYNSICRETGVGIQIFIEDSLSADVDDVIDVTTSAADEIGAYWFVVFDGGESDHQQCALLAEERNPGEYYGFWTYESGTVEDLIAYLDTAYLSD